MKLSRLLTNQDFEISLPEYLTKQGIPENGAPEDPDIKTIHYNSGEVKKEGLFVAIEGLKADGHNFINDALQKGASAIITQKASDAQTILVKVKNSRKALASISAEYFGNPSKKLFIVGVTGTNGKTTTVAMIESILLEEGLNVGVIGTIDYHYNGITVPNPMTTPESLDLQKILAEMHENGVTHVVMEVSSHAIDLWRVEKCWFDIGVFTNLSQDHLDYHGDMESYWECKKKLFTHLLPSGPKKKHAKAVINIMDKKGEHLKKDISIECVSTGNSDVSMVRPENIKLNISGISGTLSTPSGSFTFKSKAVGKHNLENILNAVGTAIAMGLSLDTIKKGVENFLCVPGRLETITNNKDRYVFVDYAHTPDALYQVLTVLNPLTSGKIICVFGCGGDRDPKKRPIMGSVAAKLSDLAVVTSDNPRSEDPLKIIAQILDGINGEKIKEYSPHELKNNFNTKGYVTEPDRRKAIALAIESSSIGDTVLIAGKGHETYQIIGDKTLPFDDRQEAANFLSGYDG